jgi:hypothetical protein
MDIVSATAVRKTYDTAPAMSPTSSRAVNASA